MHSMMFRKFDPFEVDTNEKRFGYVDVVDTIGARFEMPVGVVNGASEGPTLMVTGGLYPTEYCGIESASRLFQLVQPEGLSGRFITIPVINMFSFRFRTPMMKLTSSSVTPLDGGRINSVFPGSPDGRPTEVLAHRLLDIIAKADYHVDFRGGDFPESHLVHTIFLRTGGEIDEAAEEMAKVFGFEYVLPGTPEISHTSPGTLIYEAMSSGIASIISESGLGYREQPLEEFIDGHVQGTFNLLRHFGMLEGAPVRPRRQNFLDMTWHRVVAPLSGVFQAIADYGDLVEREQVLGLIKGLDGSVLASVVSPIDGVVHTMFTRRVVLPGDPLYTLLEIGEPTGWAEP